MALSAHEDAVTAAVPVSNPGSDGRLHGMKVDSVYFNGRLIPFETVPVRRGLRGFMLGPWQFGMRLLNGKPRDGRPNLYIVAPGTQHASKGWEQYRHNCVINVIPLGDKQADWDVYWALALDPALKNADVHSERELLLLAQERFTPRPGMSFEQVPAHAILHDFLGIDSLKALKKYSEHGSMPRVIILPAHVVLRATAKDADFESRAAASPDGERDKF